MRNPIRFIRFWQSVAVMGMLTLVIGVTPIGVLARDGAAQGTQTVTAHHVLQVNAADPALNRICVGETIPLPVTVAMDSLQWYGDGDAGSVSIESGDITPTVGNASIVRADPVSAPAGTPPVQTTINLVGLAPGTTTVTLNASLRGSVPIFLDEEVGLPISFTDTPRAVTVNVRVMYCEYEININTIWETSMHGAFTILIANARNLRLRASDTQANAFEFRSAPMTAPYLKWTFANNRIIGCRVSSGRFDSQAPNVTAVVGESNITVTITYPRAVGGDPMGPYYWNLCLPHHTAEPCSARPDGHCFTIPPQRPSDYWEPHQLDLTFDLEGGTLTPTHGLTHSWGDANGWGIVTLTPRPVRQAASP